MLTRKTSFLNTWYGAVVFCGLTTLLPFLLSKRLDSKNSQYWYDLLTKSPLTPPGYVFPIVWTALYILMGLSLWLVWRSRHEDRESAIQLFVIQFILNISWSWLYFGLRNLTLSFAGIVILLILVFMTYLQFNRISRAAGFLLLPYLMWGTFATYLMGYIWFYNPPASI